RHVKLNDAVPQHSHSRVPLLESPINTRWNEYSLGSVEGRTGALRYAAPIVKESRDPLMRDGYIRELAGWIGMDIDAVHGAVQRAPKASDVKRSNDKQYQVHESQGADAQDFR